MNGANEKSSDAIYVPDARPRWVVLLKGVAANIALRCVLLFLSLLSANSLHRSIGSELLEDRSFPLDENVQKLRQRIFYEFNHRQLSVLPEGRAVKY